MVSGLYQPGLAGRAAQPTGLAWQEIGGTLRNRDEVGGIMWDGGRGRTGNRGLV